MALHLASLWNRGLRQLGNGLLHKKPLFQRAKKVVSDSSGLVDFAIELVNSVFNLPDGQVIFFRNSNNKIFFVSGRKLKDCPILTTVKPH